MLWEHIVLCLFKFFSSDTDSLNWTLLLLLTHSSFWPLTSSICGAFSSRTKETSALFCTPETTLNLNAGRKCWSWSLHSHEREKDLKDAISWALGPEQRDPEDMLGILENDWYTQLGNRGVQRNVEKFLSFSAPLKYGLQSSAHPPFLQEPIDYNTGLANVSPNSHEKLHDMRTHPLCSETSHRNSDRHAIFFINFLSLCVSN